MRVDYRRRSERFTDGMCQRSREIGGCGWAHIPAKSIAAVERLVKLAQQYGPRGGRMLDIGCGAGDNTLLLAAKGLFDEYHGLDISEAATAWANERPKPEGLVAHFQVGSMVDLAACADESFDTVWSMFSFHWIIGEDDRRRCLAAVHRVLRPGGRFYLWTSCRSREELSPPDKTRETWLDEVTGVLMRQGQPYFHLRYPEEVRTEIGAAGLEALHWELDEREEDDSPYFTGPFIVVAEKPGGRRSAS